MSEPERDLTNFSNVTSDMGKKEEESSLAGGDDMSWHSVYKPTTVAVKYEHRPGITRYLQSLKHFLPVRVKTGPGSYMPVDSSGCCAFMFFSWLTPLIWRTFRRGLSKADLYHVSPQDSCSFNGERFSKIWEDEVKKNGLTATPLSQPLFQFIRTRYLISCLMYVFCIAFGFIGPVFFMRVLLNYIQSPKIDHVEGGTLILALAVCELFRIMFFALMWAINVRTAVRAGTAIKSLVYQKIISLRCTINAPVGELINLFSNDCQKVFMMVYTLPLIIGGPLVIVGMIAYTWWLLGPFCFIGVGVFAFCYLLQFGIAYIGSIVRRQVLKVTDERVSRMSEFLTNMKLIKFHAWERFLIESLRDTRATEKVYLERYHYIQNIASSILSSAAVLATIITILVYTMCGHDLTPAEAFTIVLINYIASHGIATLPICLRNIVNGTVALSRLQAIMHLEEKDSYISLPSSIDHSVNFTNATLVWDQVCPNIHGSRKKSKKGEVNLTVADGEKNNHHDDSVETALVTLQSESGLAPSLVDVNLTVQRGKLVGICGTVGSGKSSLFAAILGQMKLLKGQVAMRGSVAYVSQQPWIMNATLRENILFGQVFSSKRYYEAVYCCGLTEDIALLSGGDQAEISENGCNLSGGQKQRTSLARAQYADKELYLLDDPLSAVDGQVGRHIFQHCIKGALKDKTVLLITNQIPYLQECDLILYMRDGCIIEQGTHKELIGQETEYSMLVDHISKDEFIPANLSPSSSVSESPVCHELSKKSSLPDSISDVDDSQICDGQLITDEKMALGDISWDTYISYIKAAGGFMVCALVLVWFILQSGCTAFSKFWLSHWFNQAAADNSTFDGISIVNVPALETYQLVYGLSIIVMFTINIISGLFFTKTALRASSRIHDDVLVKIFYSPMHFFNSTPIGRVLNIFTRDTDEIDNNIPTLMSSFLHKLMAVIFALLMVAIVYPYFIVPLILLLICFVFVQRLFRSIMRDVKRMENVSRSPIYSHVSVTVEGLPVIKAYEKQEDFLEKFSFLVDQHASPQYLFYCSLRWIGIRMDLLCLLITLITSIFVVFLKSQVYPAYAALALTLAMQLSGIYQYVVRLGCDLESRFTSVERVLNYTEDLESESPAIIENCRPSPDWPTRGRICFLNVKMRYQPSLPLALKGLTFDIETQEKIGIVGRTGSGKSSIATALFRLVELQSGSIFIDGINIKDMGLEDLRSKMSIIPQDPVLFHGTVRYNLDPFNECSDEELWNALERTCMKDKVSSLGNGLDSNVVENGYNFSVGEKQLLWLARSFLRQSKIVFFDEATASIDFETDELIQKIIQQVFTDSTVLTIAHRLSTVKSCDRIMVIADGKIVEFDQPDVLLENPKSAFSILMSTSGL